MNADKRTMLRHFLATLSYRGTNILAGMPTEIATKRPDPSVRTPVEILNHINGVLTYAHSCFVPYDSTHPPLDEWKIEVRRFFEILRALDQSLSDNATLKQFTPEQLLQGPFADAMLHLGQIGIFRRMAGSPVGAENYLLAPIAVGNLRTP